MNINLLTLLTLTSTVLTVEAARILAVLPTASRSHHMILQPILRTIAEAGHDVVVYSMHRLKNPPPNYTDISLISQHTENFNLTGLILNMINVSPWNCFRDVYSSYEMYMTRTLDTDNVKKLLRSDEHFDLVIAEPFMAQEFTFIFGYKFKAPTIGIQTFVTSSLVNLHLGNALSTASLPEMCFGHSNKMTFWQRVSNVSFFVRNMYFYYYQYLPLVEEKLRVHFPDMPPLQDLIKDLSLMFINDHLTADYAQPRPQNIIPVAGIHIDPERPLPEDIKNFMDGAENGVILFSLGSLIPDEVRPPSFFESVAKTFRNLSQRVIWKTRKENITGVPENVMVVQWMPQRDVLAHPNCVLFITHGGQASQYEAIHNAVPVIGIPHFGDQYRNVEFYVAQEVGVKLLPEDIPEETLALAIRRVIGNHRYRDNMRKLSRIFRDTPMSPKQAVVYWTEYVLRYGGAPHLKPAVVNLPWHQRVLLDVILLIAFLFVSVYFIVRVVVKAICSYLYKKRKCDLGDKKSK